MSERYDLFIIGAGPAGLTAAIYAARAGLRFAVLELDGWGGGQISSAVRVQNYPGVPEVIGAELGERIREQAVSLGAVILLGAVEQVTSGEGGFIIRTEEGETYLSRTVLAAPGAAPARLEVPGAELAGVAYCAVCDGAFFTGKRVTVVGGGDTGVEDALYLAGICSEVTVLLRGGVFRAAAARVAQLEGRKNVRILPNRTVQAIEGDGRVERLLLSTPDGPETLETDGVFVAIGTRPATDCLQTFPDLLRDGYLSAGEDCVTPVPGLFAAGDARTKRVRQVTTAVADGANAVASVLDYLRNN